MHRTVTQYGFDLCVWPWLYTKPRCLDDKAAKKRVWLLALPFFSLVLDLHDLTKISRGIRESLVCLVRWARFTGFGQPKRWHKVAKRVESQVELLIKMKGLTIKSSGPGASASRPCAPELWGKGMAYSTHKPHVRDRAQNS